MIFGSKGLHVGKIRWGGCWKRQRLGRFTHLSVKLFQAGWNGELQEPSWLTPLDQEAMSDILGQNTESSSLSLPAAFSADEGEFPFEP
ncbi:hypothetical protein A4R35_01130 [Thermogemmatispora tikiterensis]|uniref:Uncharacterized protein n=1 Tax=Thermogemmatispora tikiterensis TaxID=1825093 RepID=A0A328VIK4_9CHLR|nr:hypothetical protein A4R35_01130 [Thermogemmatispora tikiterensis]